MRFIKHHKILNALYNFIGNYPAPSNITYLWNFGVYSLTCLAIQIITGIALAMHYTPEINLAFDSVEHIMRDVNYGWLLRYIHANGASMFFIVVYIHTFRGLYYGSFTYPREQLWGSGVIILFLMIITAFMGYVLPWGQMSFWGATVITNLVSAIPKIGTDIVIWLWGGYSINNATLNKFFSLHYFLPFIILGVVFIHLIFLHEHGSNNPLGIRFYPYDGIPMSPYFTLKDLFGLILFLIFFSFFIFFAPNTLGHPDNYIEANPLVTPEHIVPEWYFLPFYAILRSIPDKLGGVIALLGAIFSLFLLPFINKGETQGFTFKPISKIGFWIFIANCLLLGWVGGKPIEYPYYQVGQITTSIYFIYLLYFMPLLIKLDEFFWTNPIYARQMRTHFRILRKKRGIKIYIPRNTPKKYVL